MGLNWALSDMPPHVRKQVEAQSRPKPKGSAKVPAKESKLLAALWRDMGFAGIRDGWKKERRFHPIREWVFDIAHEEQKIAVECDGMLPPSTGGGRHQRPEGFSEDCDKINAATLLGWRVLRFTRKHIVEDLTAIRAIRAALIGETVIEYKV